MSITIKDEGVVVSGLPGVGFELARLTAPLQGFVRFAQTALAFLPVLRAFWASFFWDDCQKKLAPSEAGRNAFDFPAAERQIDKRLLLRSQSEHNRSPEAPSGLAARRANSQAAA